MNSSFYPHKRIKTLDELSEMLDISVVELNSTVVSLSNYYKANPQTKSDGTLRITYITKPRLKKIQIRIKERILDRVKFAKYLFFGIKGRKPIDNAKHHCQVGKPLLLIALDIEKFYPSLTSKHVYNIWLNFFKFSEPVASLLTSLTTYNNELPQGASTSNHLSNLVFFDSEPTLVKSLKFHGFTYSRYADDIAVTTHKPYKKIILSKIINITTKFLENNGFKQNRKKLKISTVASRMIINKTVCINNAYMSVSSLKREIAKRKVFQYIEKHQLNPHAPELITQYRSVLGYLYHIKSIFPHKDCLKLIQRLRQSPPKLDPSLK